MNELRLKQGLNKLQEDVRKELKEKKSVSVQKWRQYLTVLDKQLNEENLHLKQTGSFTSQLKQTGSFTSQLKQTGSFTSQLKQTGLQKGG